MPVSDSAIDSLRLELSEAIRDLEYVREHSQPHIHLRREVGETWDAAFRRVRKVRDELYRRAHGQASAHNRRQPEAG